MPHIPSHPQAIAALRAAGNWHIWGRYATVQFARKRGVPLSLITLARVLRAGANHDQANPIYP